MRWIDRITARRLLWIAIIVFTSYFLVVAFARHDNFYSRRLDLGNMDQTVWNVLHGNGFTLTDPMGTSQESRLAVHADFLMVFMAPLYLLWSDPKMLIFVQVVVVCLGALPVYWIANEKLKSKHLSLLFALGYLMYPPLERMMLHDFHAVALSTTFLLFAYWYMVKERYGWFVFFAVLAGLGKEQVWLAVGLMGIYIAVRNKRMVLGFVTAALGFFFFYYLFWMAIPAVTPAKQHFALAYLSDFGDRQNVILKNIIEKPWSVLRTVLLPDRLYYYFQLLISLGFLPLFAPWILIFCAHSVLINSLSNNALLRQIDYQYTSDITPFIFIAAVEGYVVVRSLLSTRLSGVRRTSVLRWLPVIVMICIIGTSIAWGELPIGFQSRFLYFTSSQPENGTMRRVEQEVKPMYTVSATNNIGAHFAQRKYLYNFPLNASNSDYSVALLGDQYAWPSGDAQKAAVQALLVNPDYTLIAHMNNFYAFKRKTL